ncbi:NAD(P)H dehydrogenase [Bifidobacterium aemilianum]|uniref:NAD(P)H dehydrogenase n=1 Tax=Bifidobacterium aemilianum TaxID=2493120 RepID=A0A366K6E8_9BIFI|nr:NAD(P)H-dependent oxidoreductase [Bifidobacterium aemilianum]RBP97320.1 NAD(P)H dehydrogenase [Bifidobacterium aemilianum]
MSKLLIITSNPEPDSLTNAAGAAVAQGAEEKGVQAEILDLYDVGFNPVYTLADREHYLGRAPMPEDVLPIQQRIAQADALVIVFPMYWFTMPAMVKGLFDRVICRGFAYSPDGTPGALAGKKVRLVMLMGGTESGIKELGVEAGLRAQICSQTFGKYCDVSDVDFVYIEDLTMGDDSEPCRQTAALQLEGMKRLGASLV